jgi:hypothetical protein
VREWRLRFHEGAPASSGEDRRPKVPDVASLIRATLAAYRAAMPITKALTIMSEMVGTQIDADCFAALCRALGRIDETLAA